MYSFQFVKVMGNGKQKTETFRSIQSAHTAMGIYAGKHDFNVDVHQERWREDARTIMYTGDNPILGTVGYIAQVGPSSPQPEPREKRGKLKSDQMSRMPIENRKVKTKIKKRTTA